MIKNLFLRISYLVVSLLLLTQVPLSPPPKPASVPYNIILVLTDDQRWDTLCDGTNGLAGICDQPIDNHPMPTVETELLAKGTIFTNAYASVPLCCPFRASLLSGGFDAHHTNVLDNVWPNGGFTQFADATSLGTVLQQNGYQTALIGKYLNGYNNKPDLYVPPGWDLWVGQSTVSDWNNDYEFVVGSSTYYEPGVGTAVRTTDGTYLTDYLRDQALDFIDQNCQYQSCSAPFFIYLTPFAPHAPATPAPRHAGLFSDFVYRERGYGELPDGDLSDKPGYAQNLADRFNPAKIDLFSQHQLASLRAVDEAVAAILDNLTQKDLLNNTVVIFASDNGFMWGEHILEGKYMPYEESIRVPLIVRLPGNPPASVDRLVAADLDLPPTILQLAGVTPLGGDGASLLPLLSDPLAPWRSKLLIQGGFHLLAPVTTWAGIIFDGWKYIEYSSGEKELYNLAALEDPYELYSKHNDPAYQSIMADLADRLSLLQRGLAIKTDNLPDVIGNTLPAALNGQFYTFQYTAWGGNGSYVWSPLITQGLPTNRCTSGLPPGLDLSVGGVLAGTPQSAGTWEFCIQVEDTSISPQPGNGRPQAHVRLFALEVFTATGTLQGTVTDAFTGSPINGATVTAGSASALSGSAGFYQFTDLPTGTYDVTASAAGYLPSTVAGVVITVGGVVNQDLALWTECLSNCLISKSISLKTVRAGVSGHINVEDANGLAISGAKVFVHWILPDGSTQDQDRRTNPSGLVTFRLTSILPGTYTITITNLVKIDYTFDPAHSALNASITR